jgi:hypothetical protein
MLRRHSWVSCGIALASAACVACAASAPNNEHGPTFGDAGNEAATDATAGDDVASGGDSATSDDGTTTADAATGVGDATTANDSGQAPDAPGEAAPPPPPPQDGGSTSNPDAASCTSTMALLAMANSNVALAHFAAGAWSVATLAAAMGGASAPSVPSLVAFSGGFLGTYVGAFLESTTYAGSWVPPAAIGTNRAQGTPALAVSGSTAHLVYWGTDGKYYHDEYDGTWSASTDPVEPDGGLQSFGSSGPAAAALGSSGSSLVVVQAGTNGMLYDQTWSGGGWQDANPHAGPTVVPTIAPAVVALQGGAADLLVVYVRAGDANDYHLEYTTRSGGTWSAPAEVYDAGGAIAFTGFAPSLAALPGGGAVVAWQGGAPSYSGYASVFSGSAWTAPVAIDAAAVAAPPAVAAGVCGATAVAAFVDTSGQVQVATLGGSTWSAPTAISGATGMNSVAIASIP